MSGPASQDDTWDRAMMKLDHAQGIAATLGEFFTQADSHRGGALYGIADLLDEAKDLLTQNHDHGAERPDAAPAETPPEEPRSLDRID